MSRRIIIGFTLFFTVLFISCSKNTAIQQFILCNNDEVLSIKESQEPNDYYVWYYYENYRTARNFLENYGFTDVDDWTVTETHLFTEKLKSTYQKEVEKEFKSGHYIMIEFVFDDKSMDAYEIQCEVFHNIFETNVSSKMPASLIDSAITKEQYTGVHKINKKFFSFDKILYHWDSYIGYYCKSEKDLLNVLEKYGLDADFSIDNISKHKGIEYKEEIYNDNDMYIFCFDDYIKTEYKTGFYICIESDKNDNDLYYLGFLDFKKQPEITSKGNNGFSCIKDYLNIDKCWVYDF